MELHHCILIRLVRVLRVAYSPKRSFSIPWSFIRICVQTLPRIETRLTVGNEYNRRDTIEKRLITYFVTPNMKKTTAYDRRDSY